MGLFLSDGDSRNIADTGALDRGGIKEVEGGGRRPSGMINPLRWTPKYECVHTGKAIIHTFTRPDMLDALFPTYMKYISYIHQGSSP